MAANKYYIRKPINEPHINIPLEMEWFNEGQEDSIELFQTNAAKEVVGVATDFETLRFSHREAQCNPNILPVITNFCYDINYEFYFFSGNTDLSDPLYWGNSYLAKYVNGTTPFSVYELYYNTNTFSKSFFKLDLYDLPDEKAQTNYITIIIPTQQGFTEQAVLNINIPNVDIKKPQFRLDYLGDKEGFFIYWLKKKDFLNIDTFYMTAKFFDARNGQFTKMMTVPQSDFTAGNTFYSFDGQTYFYYQVVLDYNTATYQVLDSVGNRVGARFTPIKWYEYVNPK